MEAIAQRRRYPKRKPVRDTGKRNRCKKDNHSAAVDTAKSSQAVALILRKGYQLYGYPVDITGSDGEVDEKLLTTLLEKHGNYVIINGPALRKIVSSLVFLRKSSDPAAFAKLKKAKQTAKRKEEKAIGSRNDLKGAYDRLNTRLRNVAKERDDLDAKLQEAKEANAQLADFIGELMTGFNDIGHAWGELKKEPNIRSGFAHCEQAIALEQAIEAVDELINNHTKKPDAG